MAWPDLLRPSFRKSRSLGLPPQDCPVCWKARAYAGFWGRGTCRSCSKLHYGRLFGIPFASGGERRRR
jgi:hypothetical protein